MTAPHSHPLVRRVRHELKLRELEVAKIDVLSPSFLAIVFKGEALADFTSLSFDDHVKIMFDGADGTQLRRDYTPRSFDPEARMLTIEFALHGDGNGNVSGSASDWARKARVGDRLLVGGPRGSMVVPFALGWHLLAGDATALPAIARRLEELPADSRAFVIVCAPDADRRVFAGRAALDLRWVSSAEELAAAVETLALPDPETGFAWAGGEAAAMARVRQALLDKGVPQEHMRVSNYWKLGAAGD